jgi:hypothetical protein
MSLSVGVSSAWKSLSKLSVGVGGVYKTAYEGWVGVGGVWKRFLGMSISLDTTSVAGASSGHATTVSAQTGYVTITVTGNTGTLTYAWAYVSGDSVTAHGTGLYRCYWSYAAYVPPESSRFAVWNCTVTDNTTGQVVVSPNVNIELDLYDSL